MSDWRGKTFEVRLGPPGHGGFCVGRHEGRVVFVRHGLPGELVRARVTEDAGGSFCRADAIEILEASTDRVAATCPVSGPGGAGCCDFSHATPAAQRGLKASVVAEQLRRIAGIDRDIVVEPLDAGVTTGGWRTRVRLPVDAAGRAGAHRYRSTEVIADLRCPQPVPGALDGIADRVWTPGADLVVAVDGDGVRHIVELAPPIDAGTGRGRDRRGDAADSEREGPGRWRAGDRPHHGKRGGPRGRRGEARPGNAERQRAAAHRAAAHAVRDEWLIEGSGRATEYVAGRRWQLAATGFWQAHRDAAQRYSDVVAQWSALDPGAAAWDLYSGVGVFAARLADQVGPTGSVRAVESARGAVADGTAALGDLPQLELRGGRVERWVAEHTGTAPEVVVLDPPRAGAGKAVIGAVATVAPDRIVHIGCDPASFARDLGLYRAAGYQLTELRAFDAFPATHHVECLALLQR
ncbi:class I SAM-dependent RNA methyltransferase [Nocardia cyriacigeorgica]|uniref:Class I SAM-dependent RNA methyltransferase n=1 Tax=Nocardia cyriacigeorgica TaxID=135487 RepID=A0A6P1CZX7_9NOCA|nr:class I SAM-dependent RNA methyltransferase [Nocardia cyriacigeorgica]NEW39455.1 class I SAM-dependent RNA methyltransferase [Nocardia cyriacigeorgica]NEW43746.1 class I SAM-dependent RNA methyltransferase [Nocardia cyriacigeorgica]NEW49975.1 class I SAM-dependent RNA methyltransferase [Nocardia cyriacigeorgica]